MTTSQIINQALASSDPEVKARLSAILVEVINLLDDVAGDTDLEDSHDQEAVDDLEPNYSTGAKTWDCKPQSYLEWAA